MYCNEKTEILFFGTLSLYLLRLLALSLDSSGIWTRSKAAPRWAPEMWYVYEGQVRPALPIKDLPVNEHKTDPNIGTCTYTRFALLCLKVAITKEEKLLSYACITLY
jgi:hypothetical protein